MCTHHDFMQITFPLCFVTTWNGKEGLRMVLSFRHPEWGRYKTSLKPRVPRKWSVLVPDIDISAGIFHEASPGSLSLYGTVESWEVLLRLHSVFWSQMVRHNFHFLSFKVYKYPTIKDLYFIFSPSPPKNLLFVAKILSYVFKHMESRSQLWFITEASCNIGSQFFGKEKKRSLLRSNI
jgi:hypothetical protein